MNQNRLFQWLKFALGWPLSFLALFFLLKLIVSKSGSVLPNLEQINFLMVGLGILSFLVFYFIRNIVWTTLLEYNNGHVSLKNSSFLWASSELKRYIPGNIWSFLGRVVLFENKTLSKSTILKLMLYEQELVVIGGFLISIFGINILQNAFPFLPPKPISNLIFILGSLLLACVFTFSNKVLKNTSSNFIKRFLKVFPNYSIEQKLWLLFLYVIAFFFYGLGTYFSTIAVVHIKSNYLFEYIGFFSLSLIIGYLTLITPTGIGVRELIVTKGLAVFLIPLNVAALAALFSRIILIISEVLFLLVSYLWYKSKFNKLEQLTIFISSHKQEVLLTFFIFSYFAYFITVTILKYTNFFTGRFDLGNMDQTVWNTLHGRIFEMTDPNGTNIISRLAFHADFILVLLAPLYLLWSDPRMLLILQTVIVGFGAVFIYLLAKEILKNKSFALVFSLLFLLYPALEYTNLYDFHPVTLATTLILGAFYFITKRNFTTATVLLLLVGLTKEEEWIIVALMGLYLYFFYKQKILGAILFIASIVLAWFLVTIAIPHALGSEHFALSYYSDFGTKPSSVIKNIIIHPDKTIFTLFGNGQKTYLIQLFEPIGFLSLLAPLYLLFIIPEFMLDLLSNNPQLHQIYYQYTAPLTAFIFISAIYGTAFIFKKFASVPTYIILSLLVVCSFYGVYMYGPLPGAKYANVAIFENPLQDASTIEDFITDIPPRFSIAATNNLGSHLSHRQRIFTIPVGINQADIILFLLNDPYAQPSLSAQQKMAQQMRKDKNYIQVFKQGDFIAFEKRNLYVQKSTITKKSKLFPLSIPTLQHRDYTGSKMTFEKRLVNTRFYTSYLASFQSDGLKEYTTITIPKINKPVHGFPILIMNHGYVLQSDYTTENSYTDIANSFAESGYIVVKPDYRGYGNSEKDSSSLLRFAYPIDVMNLLYSLGSLRDADRYNVVLWGHALGGGVTLETLETLSSKPELTGRVRAAVLWAPISDPISFLTQNKMPTNPTSLHNMYKILGQNTNSPLWQSVQPLNYLNSITAPVLIDQGTSDTIVPENQSIALTNDLLSLNKIAQLKLYQNDDNQLSNNREQVLENDVLFFNKYIVSD